MMAWMEERSPTLAKEFWSNLEKSAAKKVHLLREMAILRMAHHFSVDSVRPPSMETERQEMKALSK